MVTFSMTDDGPLTVFSR